VKVGAAGGETSGSSPGPRSRVLLTGASGYVGGRLLGALVAQGYRVRCLARRPEYLRDRVGAEIEVVAGDVLDLASLAAAMDGVEIAYYLVHSMGTSGDFVEEDRRGAANFGAAARAAGVRRIIYLGGLGEADPKLSPHLRSRHEVGEILRCSGVAEVVELRASIVIGSGSLSFEMIRALVERLPVMVTPRWVSMPAQPIAIGDLLAYLVAAIRVPIEPAAANGARLRVFEIGGADQVSYGDIMREYGRQRGLDRVMIRVPVLTPRLSSLWLGLVTPLYARIGRKLVDSLRHPTVVTDDSARLAFPDILPVGMREAVAAAFRNEEQAFAATRWSDALSASGRVSDFGGLHFGSRIVDSRVVHAEAPREVAFAPIRRIGGETGWYYADFLWRVRGFIDLLVGGVGVRRGRRDPETLRVGDTVDWWRVETLEPGRRLRLIAEMKLPGRAWLEFEVAEEGAGRSSIRQTAIFDPVGLLGLVYWYTLYPLHWLIFEGMLARIKERAEMLASGPPRG
jgi:uncharacterized protein YbjT (DUF2867 family)